MAVVTSQGQRANADDERPTLADANADADADSDALSEMSDEPLRTRLNNMKNETAMKLGEIRQPRSRTPSNADSDAVAIRMRTRKIAVVADGLMGEDDAEGDSDYVEEVDEEVKMPNRRRKVTRRAVEVKQEVRRRRVPAARAPPTRGEEFATPCERCERMETTCHEQAAGTGRGACFQCGKAKVRCSKSLVEKDSMPGGEKMARSRPMKRKQNAV